jgi:hypothetical protein
MVNPPHPSPFAIELPEFLHAAEEDAPARWYRVIQYETEQVLK